MALNTIQQELKKSFELNSLSTAIKYDKTEIKYKELYNKSKSISKILENIKLEQKFIGLLIDDRINMITSIIGTIMTRNIFVPLDFHYPINYLANMINLTELKTVFFSSKLVSKVELLKKCLKSQVNFICIDNISECDNLYNIKEYNYTLEDPIYVYFSSGTTGNPKAILGKNKGLTHFIKWEIDTFNINNSFFVSQFTSPAHDPFLRDIFVPLFTGATICIPDEKMITNSNDLVKWINNMNINLIHCTPSFFKILLPTDDEYVKFKHLKYIMLAGEKVIKQHIRKWYDEFDQRIQLVNLYGPTETTLAKIYHCINIEDLKKNEIPIGKPISGAKAILLKENFEVCGEGEIGEIAIRTPYRTHGYYNNEILQNNKFIQNPFSNVNDDLIFMTGDLGKINEEGDIICLGRKDRQIKYRGYRIELEAIENSMMGYQNIDRAVVKYFKNTEDDVTNDCLVGYYLSKNKCSDMELKDYLGSVLPSYMIPAYLIQIDNIPLTVNNKVDYSLLPNPTLKKEKPCSNLETILVNIWEEILEVEEIGVTDNFFDLGGHSLLLLKMEMALYDRGIDSDELDLYQYQTIRELAKAIELADTKQIINA